MTSPVLRSFPAFGYDPVANALVLYGGVDSNIGTYLNDTWKFPLTGTTWAALTPTTNPTSARQQMGFAYDSTRLKFLMWGGRDNVAAAVTETSSFDLAGNIWSTVATLNPGGRQLAAMAYQTARDRVVLFGGEDSLTTGTTFSDTWEFNPGAASWTQRTPSTTPAARVWHAMAHNPSNGLIYMVGGVSTFTGSPTFLTDTWGWDGTNWTLINSTLPLPGGGAFGQCLSYSSANSTMMYVANDGAGSINTYLLVGSSWVQQTPVHAPLVGDIFQSMIPDGPGVAFLGTDVTGAFSVPWHWSGMDWTDLTAGLIPPPPIPPTPPPRVLTVPAGSPLQQIFTHVLDAQNRLIQQYKTQPKFLQLIAVFAGRAQVVENAIIGVYLGRTLNNAVGVQLDGIGRTVGLSRSDIPLAADDEVYRVWLKAWVRVNLSSGTIPDIIDLFKAVTPAGTTIQVFNSGVAAFRVVLGGTAQTQAPTLIAVLNSIKGAGIKASIDYELTTPLFGFDGAGAGFDTGYLGGSV